MTLDGLKAKGTIDLEDDINFRTHADVLRLFGKDVKLMQQSFVRHPVEEKVWISFWIFYQDDANDWENTWGQKEETAFERRKFDNEEYLNEMAGSPDRHTRILFAKIAPFSKVFYNLRVSTILTQNSRKRRKRLHTGGLRRRQNSTRSRENSCDLPRRWL